MNKLMKELSYEEMQKINGGKAEYAEYSWSGTDNALIYAGEAIYNAGVSIYNGGVWLYNKLFG